MQLGINEEVLQSAWHSLTFQLMGSRKYCFIVDGRLYSFRLHKITSLN